MIVLIKYLGFGSETASVALPMRAIFPTVTTGMAGQSWSVKKSSQSPRLSASYRNTKVLAKSCVLSLISVKVSRSELLPDG